MAYQHFDFNFNKIIDFAHSIKDYATALDYLQFVVKEARRILLEFEGNKISLLIREYIKMSYPNSSLKESDNNLKNYLDSPLEEDLFSEFWNINSKDHNTELKKYIESILLDMKDDFYLYSITDLEGKIEIEKEKINNSLKLLENEIEYLEYQKKVPLETDNKKNASQESHKETKNIEQNEISDKSVNQKINLTRVTKAFFDETIQSKQVDINRTDFVSAAKKILFGKISKEYELNLSQKNRESIRTYLSKLKTGYLKKSKRTQKKK